MSSRYDPMKSSDPEEWLGLDQYTRIELVKDYHRRNRIRMPNLEAHACFHVVVENQLAEGDKLPTKKKLKQLMEEGLDRHQAIHAIASVIANHFYNALKEPAEHPDLNKEYFANLEALTAQGWLKSGEE